MCDATLGLIVGIGEMSHGVRVFTHNISFFVSLHSLFLPLPPSQSLGVLDSSPQKHRIYLSRKRKSRRPRKKPRGGETMETQTQVFPFEGRKKHCFLSNHLSISHSFALSDIFKIPRFGIFKSAAYPSVIPSSPPVSSSSPTPSSSSLSPSLSAYSPPSPSNGFFSSSIFYPAPSSPLSPLSNDKVGPQFKVSLTVKDPI